MELKYIFEEYLEYCSLYRRMGTYDHYKQDFRLLTKVFESLKINDTKDLNQKTYNNIVSWLKTNTSNIRENNKNRRLTIL